MKVLVVMNSSNVKLGGGIIQVILNFRNQLIGSTIEYSFAINIENDDELINRLTYYGEKYYYIPDKKKSLNTYIQSLYTICKNNKFDAIHIHGNSATMVIELLVAYACGIKKRIVHCHNSKCNHPLLNFFLHPIFVSLYTKAVACSDIAGNWIFGKNKFVILHNAIDLNKFLFSKEIRDRMRLNLNISEDTLVVGHIGNFNEQKNQEFLVRVFKELQQERKSILLLFGDGSLKEKVKDLVTYYNLEDKVHFEGVKYDIYRWMSALDIFVFPSRWEGLGMVAIEAQANGLPVIASDMVPESANLGNITFLSLNDSYKMWSDTIIRLSDKIHSREINLDVFSDYDISKEKNKLINLYLE